MLKFIAKKLLQMIPMLLLISFIVFAGLQATGIDPISYMVTPDMAGSAEQQDALRDQLGLNDPFIIRYFNWIKDIITGNFGYSIVNGTSINTLLAQRLPATFELAIIALILSSIIGIGIGIISAIRQNGIVDYIGRVFAVLGQSIPQFFFGICVIQLFAIKLGWLPANGRYSPGGGGFSDALVHLILPVLTMTVAMCAVLMRYALYFSSFAYHCREEDLRLWRSRTYPFRTEERTRTADAWDVSIKKAVPAGLPCDYPGGEVRVYSVQEKGFSLGWSDREFENGMACASPHVLYQKDGYAKSCFLKLVRSEDRFIGETLDYPNLGLLMGASNFPDDGRKTVVREGNALRVSYRPRSFLRGAAVMKLDVIFSTHFSPPDAVSIGGRRVEDRDGRERFPLETAAVRDGEREFSFQPVDGQGFWRVVERNHFLNLEWVREMADFDAAEWTLLLRCRRE